MKLPWQVIAGLVVAVLLAAGTWYVTWRIGTLQQAVVVAQLEARNQRTIAEFTVARLAVDRADKDALAGLLEATNKLHGELLAGMLLHLPGRDTTINHIAIPTETHPDSTRTATFQDSTYAGTLHATVTAPPCCRPLGISYQLTSPDFDPQIGFVQVGDTVTAVVYWQGQQAEIKSPYMRPRAQKLQGIHGFGGGYFDVLHGNVEARGGLETGLGNQWNLQAGGSTESRLFIGLTKSFNLFSTKR
jgi:hypothetical protein